MLQLTVPGTWNVRDPGGFQTRTGKTVKTGVMLRSGNLDKLPAASQKQLIDYGVKTVVDIRDEWEAENYPNVFINGSTVIYRNVPFLGDALSGDQNWQAESSDFTHLHELYIKYVQRCQPQIADIMTAITESESVVMVHCHAGKDRTGIIAALLLSLINVPDDVIAEDYSLSSAQISHLIKEWRAYNLEKGRDMQKFERKVASDPETILRTLQFVRDTFGSTEAYLRQCGVSDATLTILRQRLLA
jgi:protein-tyrosine phosphatase